MRYEIMALAEKYWMFSMLIFNHRDGRCPFTVTTVRACPPNFEVSSPIFECRLRRSGNSSQRFAPNVPIIQHNVGANLANFIEDLFWRVSFSDEDVKTVEDLGGPWRSSRSELECCGSRYLSKYGM